MTSALAYRNLPPLNALKGFEAAARLGSFRRAAEELKLTHVAISHQIKALEENLGCRLFHREGRSIRLSEDGRLFYDHVRPALELIIVGAQALRHDTPDTDLRVETYLTVAIRWLSQRLPRFRELHPEISLAMNTRRTQWWFDELNTDIAIVLVDRDLPANLQVRKLFDAALFPLCSPALLGKHAPIHQPADLLNLPLIEVSSAPNDWRFWLGAAGVNLPVVPRLQRVDTYALALELAGEGHGVAMLNGPFAEAELSTGRLVCPYDFVASPPGYWAAVYPADRGRDPRLRAFLNWLISEVRLD